ncbi:hypothetical protein ACFNF2_004878 [Salmonella enterica]
MFAVHGVDQNGKTVLVKSRVTRAALPGLIASLPPCVIGMEACSGAHYWARLFLQYGHEPRLMAAKLRTLLVQGARSVLIGAEKRTDSFSRWVCSLVERRGYWRAVVAIAAKNARLCWASLHYGDDFRLYSAS